MSRPVPPLSGHHVDRAVLDRTRVHPAGVARARWVTPSLQGSIARRVDESRRLVGLARELLLRTPVRRRIGWPRPSDDAVAVEPR